MRKLNKRKVRWIIKQIDLGELSVCQIARQQNITPQHARRVFARFKDSKNIEFLKPGRKTNVIGKQEIRTVLALHKKHPLGAVNLEKILKEQKRFISHNRIHKILKDQGLAKDEPKKQKRRKWILWERKHSNSLWHIDYCKMDGKWVLGVLDDASRFVPACKEFQSATAENAVIVLDKAVKKYGPPKQMLSDNGSHFSSVIRKSCPKPKDNIFQKRLNELGIKHIKARANHPQTNGKLERWFGTIKPLKKHYNTMQKALNYYNYRRPHMSLENGSLRTPHQAYQDKSLKG